MRCQLELLGVSLESPGYLGVWHFKNEAELNNWLFKQLRICGVDCSSNSEMSKLRVQATAT
eukprot:2196553-Alexandrium_andersonii.AAC.1